MFSDIVFLFYVSGFELFLDFDVSECSKVFFVEIEVNKNVEGNNEMGLNGEDGV